jgi:hypothetical protein
VAGHCVQWLDAMHAALPTTFQHHAISVSPSSPCPRMQCMPIPKAC